MAHIIIFKFKNGGNIIFDKIYCMLKELILCIILEGLRVFRYFGKVEKFTHYEFTCIDFLRGLQSQVINDLEKDRHVRVEAEVKNLLICSCQEDIAIFLFLKYRWQEVNHLWPNELFVRVMHAYSEPSFKNSDLVLALIGRIQLVLANEPSFELIKYRILCDVLQDHLEPIQV